MLSRLEIFPNVLEMNVQARRRLGCCVYLVHDGQPGGEWLLIDIGYTDTVDEIVELIRQCDFPLAKCKYLVATHADADHIQGLARAKELLPSAEVVAHPHAAKLLEAGERIETFAEISAQDIDLEMPPVKIDREIDEGDTLSVGDVELTVWHTPGHAPAQLAFQYGDILFSGDNVYRDGCIGAIAAHHGSDIEAFIASIERIKESDVRWLLPSHGPVFEKDDAVLEETIARLKRYANRADFGTCAVDWPLLHEWDEELAQGVVPK